MKLFAKKSLGQHFLNSTRVLEQIISASAIQNGEAVLEIGPGTGFLTEALMRTGAEVVAIEKDARAIADLREKFANRPEFKLIEGDVLEINPADLGLADKKYALVANIPYYITGAILEQFLEHAPRPNRLVLLVQKAVADRILARDGKESILSISVKAFGKPKIIARVPKGAFTPPPTVDSAILAIDNVTNEAFSQPGLDIRRFFAIVRAGFAHKRKYLIRNLEDVIAEIKLAEIWQKLNLDPKARAENVDVKIWLKIAVLADN